MWWASVNFSLKGFPGHPVPDKSVLLYLGINNSQLLPKPTHKLQHNLRTWTSAVLRFSIFLCSSESYAPNSIPRIAVCLTGFNKRKINTRPTDRIWFLDGKQQRPRDRSESSATFLIRKQWKLIYELPLCTARLSEWKRNSSGACRGHSHEQSRKEVAVILKSSKFSAVLAEWL